LLTSSTSRRLRVWVPAFEPVNLFEGSGCGGG
jgi:hypothetical protein